MGRNFLIVDPQERPEVLRGLASPVRVKMLKALHLRGSLNVHDIAALLELPQSTISSNLQILVEAGLIATETKNARKGNEKMCRAVYDEVLVKFREDVKTSRADVVEVAMPVGLYTSCEVSAPCGLCSTEGIIGLLDMPDRFLDPGRIHASRIWFTRGFVEYQFPNNAGLSKPDIESIEFSLELSSDVPGAATDWPSDITVTVNQKDIGTWTSPGGFRDRRGVYSPDWWTLRGSQYGMLKSWRVARDCSYVDGIKISPLSLEDFEITGHQSIQLRIGIKENARNPGGVNIFGRGFGNYDQHIVLRIYPAR